MTTGSTFPVVANLFASGPAVSPEGPQRSGLTRRAPRRCRHPVGGLPVPAVGLSAGRAGGGHAVADEQEQLAAFGLHAPGGLRERRCPVRVPVRCGVRKCVFSTALRHFSSGCSKLIALAKPHGYGRRLFTDEEKNMATKELRTRVASIEFAGDGSAEVTITATGGGIVGELEIVDTVTPTELAENNPNAHAGHAVEKSKQRISKDARRLCDVVNPQTQEDEASAKSVVAGSVRLLSMTRTAVDEQIVVRFDVGDAWTVDLAVDRVGVVHGEAPMPGEVHPDRVVIAARLHLARLLQDLAQQLGNGHVSI